MREDISGHVTLDTYLVFDKADDVMTNNVDKVTDITWYAML